MAKRFVKIWFRYLMTDWILIRQPALLNKPLAIALASHGRKIISCLNSSAESVGMYSGMTIADARALYPALEVIDEKPGQQEKLLKAFAEWFIRYSPVISIDPPDGLIIDATGCAHLWGGEKKYLGDIINRLKGYGYHIRTGMADTIGAAWALAHYSDFPIAETGQQLHSIMHLPPAALRLDSDSLERLNKLGLKQIKDIICIPASVLQRRFGKDFIQRIHQATGKTDELIDPVFINTPYQERLNSLEPILTATGIEIGLQQLLEKLSARLLQEGKGIRTAELRCYRIDGKIQTQTIGTSRASSNPLHLFKLFENKLSAIEPGPGIELFILEAHKTEDNNPIQEKMWDIHSGLNSIAVAELIDRLSIKIGMENIHRYLPAEHYWPERSFKKANSLDEVKQIPWRTDKPRPLRLLPTPAPIMVTAPVPDYPPMNFRYKGKLHKIIRADGPERIEQEWWIQQGEHRDYYYVEDENGNRYWLFRAGHYNEEKTYQWYLHGFFA